MTATEPAGTGTSLQAREAGARAVVPALDRGMRVLQLLAESPQRAYSLSEIAQLLAIPKSTAFNICGALTEGQLLRRVRDGFQLGRGLLELGSAYASSVNIVAEFYDAAARRRRPGAVIQLAVLDEDLQAVYLAHQDCGSGLRLGLGGMVGRRVPANCTAGGKMLLALLPPAELEERLRRWTTLPRVTRRSVTSRPRLLREIGAARESGTRSTRTARYWAQLRRHRVLHQPRRRRSARGQHHRATDSLDDYRSENIARSLTRSPASCGHACRDIQDHWPWEAGRHAGADARHR